MHLTKTLLLLLIFISASARAQAPLSPDFDVTLGNQYKVVDAGSKEYVSLDNGFAIFAKMGGIDLTIQKYDVNAMKEVGRNAYELPEKSKFTEILKLGDRVFYFYNVYNKKDGADFSLFCREINTSDASLKEPVELFRTSRKVVDFPMSGKLTDRVFGVPFGEQRKKFLVHKSFDGSKVMFIYRCDPEVKNDAENYDLIGIQVFDNTMTKVWGKEVKMPYTEEQINNVGYTVSSSGEAELIIVNRETKKYELLSVEDGEITSHPLDVSAEQMVRELAVREDEEGNFLCTGLYATGLEYNFFRRGSAPAGLTFSADGLMTFEIDHSAHEAKDKKLFEFPAEFIAQNLSDFQKKRVEKRDEKGKAGIPDLFLLDVFVKEDGSSFIICEQQYEEIQSTTTGPGFNAGVGGVGPNTKQSSTFHFEHAVLIKLNPEGDLAWMRKLPKNQEGGNGSGQMSISYMEGEDADYVVYIDNPKNIDLGIDGGVPKVHRDGLGGYLTAYKIDHESGKLEKHTVADITDIDGQKAYQFKTYRILRVGPGDFIMEIYVKKNMDNVVRFKLKK